MDYELFLSSVCFYFFPPLFLLSSFYPFSPPSLFNHTFSFISVYSLSSSSSYFSTSPYFTHLFISIFHSFFSYFPSTLRLYYSFLLVFQLSPLAFLFHILIFVICSVQRLVKLPGAIFLQIIDHHDNTRWHYLVVYRLK